MTKNRGAWGADARRRIILYYQTQISLQREPDLSLSGLDPVPLSKMGTHLLASLGSNQTVCVSLCVTDTARVFVPQVRSMAAGAEGGRQVWSKDCWRIHLVRGKRGLVTPSKV